MNKEDRIFWIWFSRLRGIKCVKKNRMLEVLGTPRNIWKLDEKELKKIEWLSQTELNELLDKKYRENLERYDKYLEENCINIVSVFDKQYPEKLKNIYDKPVVLYCKGNLNLLNCEGISIVGCRNCSEYGKQVARKLGFDVAKQNKCVISGLAIGIDKYAHIGALKAGGSTIAVIGNGLDNVYPYENMKLCERIVENNGLIVTEYIIGTKPDKLNFPERNRIISALSEGIVVVEAKEKSGALITVDFGLEHGKEIFAVPGNITNINSFGTNNLLKQGAHVVTSYEDIINICYNGYNALI